MYNQFLKRWAPFLASSITYLFNLSLSTSSFPCAWNLAKVIPLYKNRGSQSDPSNYRPVSLLPAIGKVMDDIQSARLISFLTTNKIISPHQFGFVPRSSTVHQLVYIIGKWTHTPDNGSNFSATFMDFMKAFDWVWHTGLLYKLAQCGISSSSLASIRDYLSNRYITVQVDGSKSLPKRISAGVPQGSHLGPVLLWCTEIKVDYSIFPISGCFAHALVARIIRLMKRSSNIDGRILLFEYSIYSFHLYISDHCGVTAEATDPYIKPGPSEMLLIDDFSRADWSGMLKALSQAPLFTAIQETTRKQPSNLSRSPPVAGNQL